MCCFSIVISYFESTNTNDENGEWGSHAVVIFKDGILFLSLGLEIPSFGLRHNLFTKWRLKGIVGRCAAMPRTVSRPTYKNLGAVLWDKQIMQGEWLRLDIVAQSDKPPLKEWRYVFSFRLRWKEGWTKMRCLLCSFNLLSSPVWYHCYFTTGKKT